MKGMSSDEKKTFYAKNLREETIKRIRSHFYESHKDVIINASDGTLDLFTSAKNDLDIIVSDYNEILSIFGEFEFENIFLSILFEKHSDKLILKLSSKLVEHKPNDFIDRFELLSLSELDYNIDKFLKVKLFNKIQVTDSEIKNENLQINEVIKKLCNWLLENINKEGLSCEVKRILLYYSIYWNRKFSNLKDETKRIVLLKNLVKCIEDTNYNLKIDLNAIISDLRYITESTILLNLSSVPYLENKEIALKRNRTNNNFYLKYLDSFMEIIDKTKYFLIDYYNLSFKELLVHYFNSEIGLKKKIYNVLKIKFEKKDFLYFEDISYFKKVISNGIYSKIEDSEKLIEFIIKSNYLFELMDFEESKNSFLKLNTNAAFKNINNVYSDLDLREFEIKIGKKIIDAANGLKTLIESNSEQDNSNIIKQRKYIQSLEEALIRVKNKTYGICQKTGGLIEKERLLSIPQTTLSKKGHDLMYKK